MKTTKVYAALKEALKAGKLENQNQTNYLFKVLNSGAEEQKEEIKDIFNNSDFEGLQLSAEQSEVSRIWLLNLWRTPTGRERLNNPFGYREQDAITNFNRCELAGYYDVGNYNYYVPIYDVCATDGYGFQYYMSSGKISIIG